MGYFKIILCILFILVLTVKSIEVSKYKTFSISGPGCDSSLKINLNEATCTLNCGIYLSIEQSQTNKDIFKSTIYLTNKQSSETKPENSSEGSSSASLSSSSDSLSSSSSDSLSSSSSDSLSSSSDSLSSSSSDLSSDSSSSLSSSDLSSSDSSGTTPAPATPGPATPAPAGPAPAEPAPAEPAPAEPAPAEPAPAEPAPVPTDSSSSDIIPSENLLTSLTNCVNENKLREVDIVCSDQPSTFTMFGQEFSVSCFENGFIDENEQDGSDSSKISKLLLLNSQPKLYSNNINRFFSTTNPINPTTNSTNPTNSTDPTNPINSTNSSNNNNNNSSSTDFVEDDSYSRILRRLRQDLEKSEKAIKEELEKDDLQENFIQSKITFRKIVLSKHGTIALILGLFFFMGTAIFFYFGKRKHILLSQQVDYHTTAISNELNQLTSDNQKIYDSLSISKNQDELITLLIDKILFEKGIIDNKSITTNELNKIKSELKSIIVNNINK
ncbi:hypothetical protein ACTFIU_007322 [Dictyostelium citrinum]